MITGNAPAGDGNPRKTARDLVLDALSGGNPDENKQAPSTPEMEETVETANLEDETLETGEESEEGSELEQEEETQEGDEAAAAGDEGEVNIENLSELAEAIGVENEWLYNLKIPMPDGQEPITLGQVKDRIHSGEVEAEREQFLTERQQFEAERAQAQEQLQNQFQQANAVSQELVQAQAQAEAIVIQFQQTDWETLEAADPGQAALQQQKLQTAYQAAQQKVEMAKGQQAQALNTMAQERRAKEENELLASISEWSDAEVRKTESAKVAEVMAKYGYQPHEIANVMDHRAIKAMRDLMMLQEAVKQSSDKVEEVKNIPKPLKPGGRKPAVSKLKKLEQKLDRAKTGSRNEKAAAVSELLQSVGVRRR